MMTTKLKNKVNKKTGNYICNRCGRDAGAVPMMIKGLVYCVKHGEVIQGKRSENGRRR